MKTYILYIEDVFGKYAAAVVQADSAAGAQAKAESHILEAASDELFPPEETMNEAILQATPDMWEEVSGVVFL